MGVPCKIRGKLRSKALRGKEFPQKKVLSLVLCVAVMLSVMVMGAGAAFSDQDKIENTEAVDACSALNIIGGYEDGSYHPERNIKRSEITKMICVALNGGKEPNVSTNVTPTFNDVRGTNAAWAEGYIESCVAQGIISGVGGGRFSPNGNVTGTQLAKMLLVSLGYNANTEGFVGNAWATNVNVIASQKGLYEGLESMDTSAALTRDNAAQMVWNAMNAYEVEYKTTIVTDENGKLETIVTVQDKVVGSNNDKITLLRDKYDAWVYVGTLTSVKSSNLTISMTAADRAASDPSVDNPAGGATTVSTVDFTKLTVDYSNLLGQKVKVMFKNGKTNEVLGVYATADNTIYNTVMNAVDNDNGKIKFGGTSYSTDSAITVYIDGTKLVGPKTAADFDDAAGKQLDSTRPVDNNISADEVTFVDSDDNGKIDTAILTTVDAAKVTYISSDEIVAGGTTYKYADEKIASDVEKNDYVVIRQDLYNDCKNITRADKLTGVKVTGTKQNPAQYLIDGSWYVAGTKADMNSVKSGDTVDAYTINGVVFYAKRTSGENASLSDVAIVLAVGSDIQGDKAKILKLDGTTSTIEIVDIDNAPGSGYVAKSALKQGAVYEYSVKGGEYRFKDLNTATDYFGDYTALNDGSPNSSSSGMAVAGAANSDKSINNIKVDDSAKIVLIDKYNTTGTDYKVITGKQFKSLGVAGGSNEAYSNGGIAAFISKVNGVNRVTYGVVAVNGIANNFITNDHYGYVVESSYQSSDGYMVYTIWNGTENVKVQEKGNAQRNKGTVLGYSSITTESGLADNVVGTIEDVDDSFGIVDNGIIYGVSDDQKTISLDGSNTNEITKDTVVLYVDTKDHKGYANGEIQEADGFGSGKIANVMYKLDGTAKDSDVALLIVDVKNNLHGAFKYNFGADANAADINLALSKGDVTISGALDTMTLNVPANTTLTIAAAQTNDVTINVAKGATLKVPNGTLVGANGAFTAAGDVTVNTASGKTQISSAADLTLNSNVSLQNGDKITLTGSAKLLAKQAGITLHIVNSGNVSVMVNNFYNDTSDATADGVANENCTYTWTASGTGSLTSDGWVKT